MRARPALLLLIFSVFLVSSRSASALGLGGYLSAQQGSADDWEIEDVLFSGDIESDGDLDAFGVGFVLDTAPAQDRIFSYRLNVGLERLDVDLDRFGDTAELRGLVIDNTFGFQVFYSEPARLWIGPRLRVGLYGGEFEVVDDADLAIFQLGLGVAFGANFNVGGRLIIGVTTGYSYSGFVGEVDDAFFDDNDVTGGGGTAFLNFSLMGRVGGN